LISRLWTFLQDANNRLILAWVGAGLVASASGAWAVIKHLTSRSRAEDNVSQPTVTAVDGAIAAGRDIRDSKIEMRDRPKR
jgi:hypothetical protein